MLGVVSVTVNGPAIRTSFLSTTLKIAAGGVAAEVEVRQMVSEKFETGMALQALALTGGLGLTASSIATKMLTHYRRKVHANRRRLAKR